MCDILNDIAMDGNAGETSAMDTLEAEKVDTLQPEPSIEVAVQGTTVAGASPASQSPSQMGNKSRLARKMGSIKDSTSELAFANYAELRQTKVNRKELKIDRTMEYGDHVAEVKGGLLASPSDGRRQLLVWDDKRMRMSRRNWINVTGYFACPV